MGRAKIPITWIKSDASRHVTFTKRKKGLKKKVEELAILCGVEVCMICFAPQAGKPSSMPYSWGLPGVAHVINKYRSLSKEEQDKKKLDNTSLLEQQIKKLKTEIKIKVEQNRTLEQECAVYLWDERLNSYGTDDLKRLADVVLDRIREVYDRINYITQRQQDVLQGLGNALEQRAGTLCDGNTGNNGIGDLDVMSASQLSHELIMSSQAGPYQQLITNLSAENPSSSFGGVMNTSAQSYQPSLMNQISLLGSPAYIDEQKPKLPLDISTSANDNFYLNSNAMLPEGSYVVSPCLPLKLKEQEQLALPPTLLKTKLQELMEPHMLSNMTWWQGTGLQPVDPQQFSAGAYSGSPSSQQVSEHHAEEHWSAGENMVCDEGTLGCNSNGIVERGEYVQSMQGVQLCHVSGQSIEVRNEQSGSMLMDHASIRQLDIGQLAAMNSVEPEGRPAHHAVEAREESAFIREGTLVWHLEEENNKMGSVYQSHMLADEDAGASTLDKGITSGLESTGGAMLDRNSMP